MKIMIVLLILLLIPLILILIPTLILPQVKGREAFRPFAPSVLAEEASNWFEGISPYDGSSSSSGGGGGSSSGEGGGAKGEEVRWGLKGHVSPYMSLTVKVKEGLWDRIPAVTHVDGTSRLQRC